jgi:hypothetical protein
MTVSELITASLQDLRVLQVGETASANDAAYGLSRLNDWIDSLATEGLTVYSRARTVWTISTASNYTIGTGGVINCARPTGPTAIDNVGFQDTSVTPTIEYNLGPPLTEDAYDGIPQKALTSVYPQSVYYNPTYASGLGLIYLWPIPTSTTLQGVIYTLVPVSEFSAISDTIALPPGYRRFLRTNLAKELASAFDSPLTPDLQQAAAESKGDIKRANERLMDLSCGVAGLIFGGAGPHYNIYSDT